jgi:hypothetical protein
MEFQGELVRTPNFNPDTSVSQLNNNGTALGPLPGSGKLEGILICLKNFQTQVFKASLQ